MSWVTVIWSMIASACLTVAAIYALAWYRNRGLWAHLLFAVTAASTTALAFFELRLMQAETPAAFLAARTWAHVPLFFWLVSITWFVRVYLSAGRLWLAWTICGLRAFSLFVNLAMGRNPDFQNVTNLRQVEFLGETVAVLGALPNRATAITQFASLLVVIFVADASLTAWRRGDRRAALMVGGSVEFFLLASLGTAMAMVWAGLQMPVAFSVFYLGLVAVMGVELSRDVLRASRLVHDLQASEAALRDLSGRLISAQEEERLRIARELHDNVSQQIAMLAIRIDQVAMRPDAAPAEVARSMRDLHHRSVEISTEIHNLSHRLHSSKLEMLGLAEALRGHCQELLAQGLHARFQSDGLSRPVPKDVELCLFRIVQEALNNVVKHSGAREADVTLRAMGDVLELTVADRGRGFDQTGGAVQRGLGLASMRERLRLVDGQIAVQTAPGQGTTITARVPLPRAGSATAEVAVVA